MIHLHRICGKQFFFFLFLLCQALVCFFIRRDFFSCSFFSIYFCIFLFSNRKNAFIVFSSSLLCPLSPPIYIHFLPIFVFIHIFNIEILPILVGMCANVLFLEKLANITYLLQTINR